MPKIIVFSYLQATKLQRIWNIQATKLQTLWNLQATKLWSYLETSYEYEIMIQ